MRQFDELLDAAIPVQQRSADRRPHVVPEPGRRSPYAGTGGNADYTFDQISLGSQVLRIGYQDQVTDIKQARLDGEFDFENGTRSGSVSKPARWNRTSAPRAVIWPWATGVWATRARVPDMVALLTPFSLTGAFDDFNSGRCSDRRLEGQCKYARPWALDQRLHGNWSRSRRRRTAMLAFNPGFNIDSTIEEDTQAVYAQFALKFELGAMPRTW